MGGGVASGAGVSREGGRVTARIDHAEHEAAHVVVGLALGLPLKIATLRQEVWRSIEIEGYVWFGAPSKRLAHGIVACAGIVWESKPGGSPTGARGDRALAAEYLGAPADVRTGCKIASEILRTRQTALARVARELCDRDLRPAELAELINE